MGYGAWLHGEAVGCGLVLAADLSARLGLTDAALVPRLARLCQRAGLPAQAPAMPIERWMALDAGGQESLGRRDPLRADRRPWARRHRAPGARCGRWRQVIAAHSAGV